MIFRAQSSLRFDDSASVSSTLTCDRLIKQPIFTLSDDPVEQRVRFDEDSNVFHEGRKDGTTEDLSEQWYTRSEYKAFKTSFINSVKKSRRSGSSELIEKTYKSCCQPQSTLTSEGLSSMENLDLKLVGLERYASKYIASDKSSRREKIMDVVLSAYSSDLSSPNPEAKAEIIRQLSARLSEPSKAFALHIAVAQMA